MASSADTGTRVRVLKASDVKQRSGETEDTQFAGVGALVPPFDPLRLAELFEDSNSLSQNVAAYETNVDGFGYVLEPVVDFDSDAGRAAIRGDMMRESDGEIEDDALDERIRKLRLEAEVERVRFKNFLDYIGIGISFTELRKRKRKDEEVTGNAYWEIIRDEEGVISKAVHVPSHTMRLMPFGEAGFVNVTERQRIGALGWTKAKIQRRFRIYVQNLEGKGTHVYFKEFGDPRVVSAQTGRAYESVEQMQLPDNEGPEAEEASEVIHFSIYSPASPYGVPRWIGTLQSVLGSRSMEEVNLAYFNNKGVPPLAILVSGGVLTDPAVQRIESVIEKEVKGKENFHAILAIEATSSEGSNVAPKVELKPLMSATLSDAVFQKYDERNIDKVGSSFRLPRLVRGDVRDFNKSTAWASIRFAEEQVFAGEREEFDFIFNRTIVVDLGFKHWTLRSMGPTIRDPETVVDMLTALAKVSAITPNEVRAAAAKVLGIPLPRINEEWANRPPAFTLAGRGFLPGEEDAPVTKEHADGLVEKLEALQRDVATLMSKVADRIDDDDVRAFKRSLARHGGLDLDGFDGNVSSQGQGSAQDPGGGTTPAGGPGSD